MLHERCRLDISRPNDLILDASFYFRIVRHFISASAYFIMWNCRLWITPMTTPWQQLFGYKMISFKAVFNCSLGLFLNIKEMNNKYDRPIKIEVKLQLVVSPPPQIIQKLIWFTSYIPKFAEQGNAQKNGDQGLNFWVSFSTPLQSPANRFAPSLIVNPNSWALCCSSWADLPAFEMAASLPFF